MARLQGAQARLRQGDLSTRLPVDTDDEFGQLSAGFSLMAHALQASHVGAGAEGARKTASIAGAEPAARSPVRRERLASDAASLTGLPMRSCARCAKVAGADAVVRWSGQSQQALCVAGPACPRPWRKKSIACTRALAITASPGKGAHPVIPITPHPWWRCPIAAKPGLRRW